MKTLIIGTPTCNSAHKKSFGPDGTGVAVVVVFALVTDDVDEVDKETGEHSVVRGFVSVDSDIDVEVAIGCPKKHIFLKLIRYR